MGEPNISASAGRLLQSNVTEFQQRAGNRQQLDIGKLTNGFVVSSKGVLKTADENKAKEKLRAIAFNLFPSLAKAYAVKQKNLIEEKVFQALKTNGKLNFQVHTALKVYEFVGVSNKHDILKLKEKTNFDAVEARRQYHQQAPMRSVHEQVMDESVILSQDPVISSAPPAPTPPRSPDVPRDTTELKRDLVLFLSENLSQLDSKSLTEELKRAQFPEKLDIPNLAKEIPTLFPNKSLGEIKGMQESLTKIWIKLEAGMEWGVAANVQVGGSGIGTEGVHSFLTTNKATVLVSNFMGANDSVGTLSSAAQQRVSRASAAGASAALLTHQNLITDTTGSPMTPEQKNHSAGVKLMDELNSNGIVTIQSGWWKHAVALTLHKAADGRCFLYYCNRGGRSFEQASDRALMGNQQGFNMMCWEIPREKMGALTPELLAKIASAPLAYKTEAERDRYAKPFLEGQNGLCAILGLKQVASIPKTPQKVGNCSWANCKGSVHAAAIAAAYDEQVAANPQGDKGEAMRAAISSGGTYFKRLERFGRKQGLEPLLNYDARQHPGQLSAFDHLRMLTAAADKLKKKSMEFENTPSIQQRDMSMHYSVMTYFQKCPYSISDVSHQQLSFQDEQNLYANLNAAGSGAFAFIGNRCVFNNNGQVQFINVPEHVSVGDFMQSNPMLRLSTPVFLENRTSPPAIDMSTIHRNMDINQTQQFLVNTPPGSWLTRESSSQPGTWVVAIKDGLGNVTQEKFASQAELERKLAQMNPAFQILPY